MVMNWIWNNLLTKECVVPLIGIIAIVLLAIWGIRDNRSHKPERHIEPKPAQHQPVQYVMEVSHE